MASSITLTPVRKTEGFGQLLAQGLPFTWQEERAVPVKSANSDATDPLGRCCPYGYREVLIRKVAAKAMMA